jgi:hypothetical protein
MQLLHEQQDKVQPSAEEVCNVCAFSLHSKPTGGGLKLACLLPPTNNCEDPPIFCKRLFSRCTQVWEALKGTRDCGSPTNPTLCKMEAVGIVLRALNVSRASDEGLRVTTHAYGTYCPSLR